MPSAKKNPVARKLTYYDRLVALSFNDKYCKAYYRHFGGNPNDISLVFPSDKKLERFRRRWGLNFVVDPGDVKRKLEADELRKDMEGGIFRDYGEAIKVVSKSPVFDGERIDFTRNLKRAKYLTLRINVTADLEKLLKDVEGYIKYYRGLATRGRPLLRTKSSGGLGRLDHWDIYRLQGMEKKSRLQIAKEHTRNTKRTSRSHKGESDNPAYNPILDAKHEQVRRAYRKARDMIAQIQPSKSKPTG